LFRIIVDYFAVFISFLEFTRSVKRLGCPIQKKYGFWLYNTGKIMYGHMS
jgi:hypothetical protein